MAPRPSLATALLVVAAVGAVASAGCLQPQVETDRPYAIGAERVDPADVGDSPVVEPDSLPDPVRKAIAGAGGSRGRTPSAVEVSRGQFVDALGAVRTGEVPTEPTNEYVVYVRHEGRLYRLTFSVRP